MAVWVPAKSPHPGNKVCHHLIIYSSLKIALQVKLQSWNKKKKKKSTLHVVLISLMRKPWLEQTRHFPGARRLKAEAKTLLANSVSSHLWKNLAILSDSCRFQRYFLKLLVFKYLQEKIICHLFSNMILDLRFFSYFSSCDVHVQVLSFLDVMYFLMVVHLRKNSRFWLKLHGLYDCVWF